MTATTFIDLALVVILLIWAGIYLHRTLVQRHSAKSITVQRGLTSLVTVKGASAEEALATLRSVWRQQDAQAAARRERREGRIRPASPADGEIQLRTWDGMWVGDPDKAAGQPEWSPEP